MFPTVSLQHLRWWQNPMILHTQFNRQNVRFKKSVKDRDPFHSRFLLIEIRTIPVTRFVFFCSLRSLLKNGTQSHHVYWRKFPSLAIWWPQVLSGVAPFNPWIFPCKITPTPSWKRLTCLQTAEMLVTKTLNTYKNIDLSWLSFCCQVFLVNQHSYEESPSLINVQIIELNGPWLP